LSNVKVTVDKATNPEPSIFTDEPAGPRSGDSSMAGAALAGRIDMGKNMTAAADSKHAVKRKLLLLVRDPLN
jgi:hypothetical protein